MITTVSLFQFDNTRTKWWAFKQMRLAHDALTKVEGLHFYKLMGSGAGKGFSVFPDFSTYCLLGVWENERAYRDFLNESELGKEYKQRSTDIFTVFLKAYKSSGSWGGINPFLNQEGEHTGEFTAVITRARIKLSQQWSFWTSVPGVGKDVFKKDGVMLAKGIGEYPLMEQATFSLWQSKELMQAFAYKGDRHMKVIQKTRQKNWYAEELFARFQVLSIEGKYKKFNISISDSNI